jgi:hypothetical protein
LTPPDATMSVVMGDFQVPKGAVFFAMSFSCLMIRRSSSLTISLAKHKIMGSLFNQLRRM